MDQILLSIIIPMYNVEKYIEKCLDSIIPQLTAEVELIVVDDCSPDRSGELAKNKLLNIGPNATYYCHEKNSGVSAARNSGIALAKGKFCWFIDSDDYINPNAVSVILEYVSRYSPDILTFNCQQVDENGRSLWESNVSPVSLSLDTPEQLLKNMCQYIQNTDMGFAVWRRIYSLEIIHNNNLCFEPHKDTFGEDICFNLYYLNYCKRIVKIENCLYYYLLRGDSIMGRNQNRPRLIQVHNLAQKAYEKTPHTLIQQNYHLIYAPILGIHYSMAEWHDLAEYARSFINPDFAIKMCKAITINFRQHLAYYGRRNAIIQYCYAKTMLALFRNKAAISKNWYYLALAAQKTNISIDKERTDSNG